MTPMPCFPTAATVGFQMESYTVHESMGSVNVCVLASGMRERDISVNLVTNTSTAEGLYSVML